MAARIVRNKKARRRRPASPPVKVVKKSTPNKRIKKGK